MIDRIAGQVLSVEPGALVVDVHGLGLRVEVPAVVADACRAGERATLFTHLQWGSQQDPSPRLFGFRCEVGRALFRVLLDVAGIGPSTAVRIVSAMPDPADVAAAIARGDDERIRVKGVGPKLAKRVVTELREKAAPLAAVGTVVGARAAGDAGPSTPAAEDAFRALCGLELDPDVARRLVSEARSTLSVEATAEELVRAVLLRV